MGAVTKRDLLECFGIAAENGRRIASYRSAHGMDQSVLAHVEHECLPDGLPPAAGMLGAAYAAGFRVGWLTGWVT